MTKHEVSEKRELPEWLKELEEFLCENLPEQTTNEIHRQFVAAVTAGVNLEVVRHRFRFWMLVDKDHGLINTVKDELLRESVHALARLHERAANGEEIGKEEFLSAHKKLTGLNWDFDISAMLIQIVTLVYNATPIFSRSVRMPLIIS